MSEDHVFYVQAFYHGGMASFEIIPDGDIYNIASDGEIIASIQHHHNGWQQLSGKQFPKEVLVSIYQEIEQKKA
ncbi:MAG: hypothetical protein JWR67_2333 [Mucilaginibacter sp.]|nr:hypothetical protein [Mucilaginibacter sp.]